MVALILASLALAQDPWVPSDVIISLEEGLEINWTRGVLIARVEQKRGIIASIDYKAMEKEARMRVGELIKQGWNKTMLTSDMTLEDLESDPSVTVPMKGIRHRFRAVSTHYMPNGDVSLVAEWDLASTLIAWTNRRGSVRKTELVVNVENTVTGLLVDARDCDFTPVYAPSIVSHAGEVIFDGLTYNDQALKRPSATYVTSPVHPATKRVGDAPEIVIPASCDVGSVTLSEGDELSYDMLDAILSGGLVIVVNG
jgi:hypothetical protein